MSEILPQQFCIIFMYPGRTWTNGYAITVDVRNRHVREYVETAGPYAPDFQLDRLDESGERWSEHILGTSKRTQKFEYQDAIPCRYVPCFDDGWRIFGFEEERDSKNFPQAQQRLEAWRKVRKEIPSNRSDAWRMVNAQRCMMGKPWLENEQKEWEDKFDRRQGVQWPIFLNACIEFWRVGASVPVTRVRPGYLHEQFFLSQFDWVERIKQRETLPKTLRAKHREMMSYHLKWASSPGDKEKLIKANKLMLWDKSVTSHQRKTLEKKVKRAAARGVVSSAFARAWFQMHAAVAQVFKGSKPKTQQTKQPRRKQTA
jgi:hypothetical protein